MFSRLAKIVTEQKPRQLLISSMFVAYIGLAVTNVIVNRNGLSVIDIGFLTTALTGLGAAIAHSQVRAIHNVIHDHEDEQQENGKEPPQHLLGIRNSSHNIINAGLHAGTSTTFITFDALLIARVAALPASTPLYAAILRMIGSGAWGAAAWMNLFTGCAQDRKQENHPDEKIRALGITREGYNLTNEILYGVAAIFYAAALYSEDPISGYKAAANALWLAAAALGIPFAIRDFAHRNDEPAAVKNGNPNDVIIVLPDSIESDSSEVVIQRPGM